MTDKCPNCGAPVHGYFCEYCGTQVAAPGVPDFAYFQTRDGEKIVTLKGQITARADSPILLPQHEQYLRKVILNQNIDRIADFISITMQEDWDDPIDMRVKVLGMLRVLEPNKKKG